MKAAIVNGAGQVPQYGDYPEPPVGRDEVRVHVTAAALSHVTRSRASGTHYSSAGQFPLIPGIDGTGRLDNGRHVYFFMPTAPLGSFALSTVVPASHCIELPANLDPQTAAAIAIPGVSSWGAFAERAHLKRGETVLINGATGAAGRLAIQIAKHFGAKKIIVTGRNPANLALVSSLGADVVIPLVEDDEALEQSFQTQFAQGVDVVLDYLWGRSARLALIAAARVSPDGVPVRYISIGSAGGQDLDLPSAVLRSSSIELKGSGLGSIAPKRFRDALIAMVKAAPKLRLSVPTRVVPLAEIASAWTAPDDGRRIVLTPGAPGV